MSLQRAVILAGGKGVRLRPFTASFPKPLVPLGDKPILEIVMQQLIDHGFDRVTLSLGHLSHLIRAFINSHPTIPRQIKVDFVCEEKASGTAGSLASIDELEDDFLVLNGDVLTNLDYDMLLATHRRSGAALTIASHVELNKCELGVLVADQDGGLQGYVEKPEQKFEVSMGIYAYSPRALRFIEPNSYLDLPTLVQKLIAAGEKVQVHRNSALWIDIGRPDDYARAQQLVSDRPEFFRTKESVPTLPNSLGVARSA